MKHALLLFFSLLLIPSCAESPAPAKKEDIPIQNNTAPSLPKIIEQAEAAHKVSSFKSKPVVQYQLKLIWNGQERLNATVTSKTNSTGIRMEDGQGAVLIFDGEDVYKDAPEEAYPRARFDIHTWQYFFMAPFKLTDPGTNWSEMSEQSLDGQSYERAKLTFEPGTGDAPDDWYILYASPETQLTYAMAYIVTYFGSNQEEAMENAHAISYHDYSEVDGIPMATEWKFWNWSPEKGLEDQIGGAILSNIRFLEASDQLFTPGPNAVLAPAE